MAKPRIKCHIFHFTSEIEDIFNKIFEFSFYYIDNQLVGRDVQYKDTNIMAEPKVRKYRGKKLGKIHLNFGP